MQKQPTKWKKIFSNLMGNKGLIPKPRKELIQFNSKKKNPKTNKKQNTQTKQKQKKRNKQNLI